MEQARVLVLSRAAPWGVRHRFEEVDGEAADLYPEFG